MKEHHRRVYELEQKQDSLEEEHRRQIKGLEAERSDVEWNYRKGIEKFEYAEWMRSFWSSDIVEQFSESLDWDEKYSLDSEYEKRVEQIGHRRLKLVREYDGKIKEIDQQIDDLDMEYFGLRRCVMEENEFGIKSWYPAGVL